MSAHAIDGQFFDIACRFYADGSLYLPDNRALILSDLHLGKGAAQRMTSPMPGYDTDDTLNRLEAAIMRTDPSQTILLGDSFHSPEQAEMLPVLVRLDDRKRVGLQVERLGESEAVVYFPGSPNAWAGTVEIVSAERIEFIDVPMTDVIEHAELVGRRSARLLSRIHNQKASPDTRNAE